MIDTKQFVIDNIGQLSNDELHGLYKRIFAKKFAEATGLYVNTESQEIPHLKYTMSGRMADVRVTYRLKTELHIEQNIGRG